MQEGPAGAGRDHDEIQTTALRAGSEGRRPRPRRAWGSAVIGVVLVLGASAIAFVVASGGTEPSERPVGQAKSLVPQYPEGSEPPLTTTTVAPLAPTTLPDGALPRGCEGWDQAFGFAPASIDGLAIWSDFDGWHLRLAPGVAASISGKVSGQVVPQVSGAAPSGVTLTPDVDSASLGFEIVAADEPIGFDITADCAQKQLTFEAFGPDGSVVPIDQVQLGQGGGATVWPIVAQRIAPPAGP